MDRRHPIPTNGMSIFAPFPDEMPPREKKPSRFRRLMFWKSDNSRPDTSSYASHMRTSDDGDSPDSRGPPPSYSVTPEPHHHVVPQAIEPAGVDPFEDQSLNTKLSDLITSGGSNGRIHQPIVSEDGPSKSGNGKEDDDPYAKLREFDIMFLIDDSCTMQGLRWRQVREILETIAPICASHDPDGIDIEFLNKKELRGKNIKSGEEVLKLFDMATPPRGRTHTGERVRYLLQEYLKTWGKHEYDWEKTGRLSIVVLTDGEANDPKSENKLENVIEEFAHEENGRLTRLNAPERQVGVSFFQVGNDDEATYMLERLDNQMEHCRDMVDTLQYDPDVPLDADVVLKSVIGAMSRYADENTPEDNKKIRYEREMRSRQRKLERL